MSGLKVIVLAAGKGTRLRTEGVDLPKVMRKALGRPLLHYVLEALPVERRQDVTIVVGYKREYVTEAFPEYNFAFQPEQLGTGHAVMCAAHALEGYQGDVLICYGDMPLVRRETYEALVAQHKELGSDCTLLSGRSDLKLPYGRVIRDGKGGFARIVEDRDCTPQEAQIKELNVGIYVFRAPKLLSALKEVGRDNAQGEYYLTDVPDIMLSRGDKVDVCSQDMGEDIIGVNTVDQLQRVEEILKGRL